MLNPVPAYCTEFIDIWFARDLTSGPRQLDPGEFLDVFTATPAEAAECAKAFNPKIAYPYHYKGQDVKIFESALAGSGVEVRLLNWYKP